MLTSSSCSGNRVRALENSGRSSLKGKKSRDEDDAPHPLFRLNKVAPDTTPTTADPTAKLHDDDPRQQHSFNKDVAGWLPWRIN